MKSDYETIESVVRQLYASAVWTHKIQEKEADIKRRKYDFISLIELVLLAISTSGIIRTCFTIEKVSIIVTAICSFLSLLLSLYLKLINPLSISNSHKMAANKLIAIRDDLLILLADVHREYDLNSIDKRLHCISDKLHSIYNEIPSTSKKAVANARDALRKNEYTYTDEEIDMYLPKVLRRQ